MPPAEFSDDTIIFQDHHLLALNKFAPLLTQSPPGVPSLETLAKAYIKQKYAKPAGVYLGIPHRLDRPVSGVVVFARNTKAAQRVHAQFHERLAKKTYWALIEGVLADDHGVWDDWLRKIPEESRTVKAEEGDDGAKRATLEYTVLERLHDETMIELRPATGRMHQLRVQAALRGHPILGDAVYGSTRSFGPPAETDRDRVIALHARRLVIEHPFTKAMLTLEAPLPEYWSRG